MTGGKKVQAQTHQFSIPGLYGKDSLSADDQELYELCNLSGVNLSPAVYKILMDLLKMNVSPVAITQMLKTMTHGTPSEIAIPPSQSLTEQPNKPVMPTKSSSSSSMPNISRSRNGRSMKPRDSQK
ncbi:mitotic-spindle organizing protein 2B-like [Anneissia japonica]|uniref:mitotic-spindle organizing protein 2B-like n=1 Tax=Anneissia japonica TaxID=1529436 RepID=UPI0014258D8A|nr:mitotic-spindle organizing protein 2B-like [Anneissia japonica]XP_033102188.1 mitotic-spindle organizing protein 2B-like [Anneissia japonica]XP_033102189.1 mitotic-spindle organizing protein 2B-like [Anneissia japonica]